MTSFFVSKIRSGKVSSNSILTSKFRQFFLVSKIRARKSVEQFDNNGATDASPDACVYQGTFLVLSPSLLSLAALSCWAKHRWLALLPENL